jgi:ribonucleoside-diphosphate reductase alpha chain
VHAPSTPSHATRPPLEPAPGFDPHALRVLEARYLRRDERGELVETPDQMLWRVASAVAAVEARWGGDAQAHAQRFYEALARLELLPNSPTLMNAGRARGQLSACFVLPVEDELESIFDTVKHAARIHQTGGGTGFSFSRLRPRHARLSSGGEASGPVSFMRVFDAATAAVYQGGVRRGANMGILRVDHPDVLEFIDSKRDAGVLTHFNISVAATDAFMSAVEAGTTYDLLDPRTREPVGTQDARAVWERIVRSAWATGDPGLVFIDTINRLHPTPELGEIESTNPCVVGETRLATQHGLVKIEDLHVSGSPLVCTVDQRALGGERGATTRPATPAFVTAEAAPVWKVTSLDGYEITATEWHDFHTPHGKVKLRDLRPGQELFVQSGKGQFGPEGSYDLGLLIGLITGDGCFSNRGKGTIAAFVSLWGDDRRFMPRVIEIVNRLVGETDSTRRRIGASVAEKRDLETLKSVPLARILAGYGFEQANKHRVPEVVWRGTEECVKGYLHGLFQADGTVNISGHRHAPTCSVRLSSSYPELLKDVQVVLANFGIFAPIRKRREARRKSMPDGRGGSKIYSCRADYELIIGGQSRDRFMREVGFADRGRRTQRLEDWARGKALDRKQWFLTKIESIDFVGERRVYDVTQPDGNTVVFNGLATGQCGELPLLPYESCNLGSVDLHKHLRPDGTDLDWDKLASTVRLGVRFLDDVIEANVYPMDEITRITQTNRKVGLGVMGWADLLIALGIPYDSTPALALAEKVMAFVLEAARAESRQLAAERGSFPAWKGSRPEQTGEAPLRNATVTTIAPTGTIALLAGCSSGIEPLYAVAYVRRALDGQAKLEIFHPQLEKVARARGCWSEALRQHVLTTGTLEGAPGVPDDVRALFKTAHEIAPEWHVRMQAAFQRHVENAVSKTVNAPRSATPQEVAEVYRLAYRLGCKGITVYRDGSREGQVLSTPGAHEPSPLPPASCPECAPTDAGDVP